MLRYTDLITRRRTQRNKALLICAYFLLVRYLLLSMYATRVITTEREKDRERKRKRSIAGGSRPREEDTGETVQKNCEARAALTIAMHKMFVFIYAAKKTIFVLRL